MSESSTFCFPIRDLSNNLIKLTPFLPSVHTTSFFTQSSAHPELYAHMPAGPYTSVADFAQSFVHEFSHSTPAVTTFAIIDKTRGTTPEDPEGALAGMVSYMNTSVVNRSTEIGFVVVLPSFQRTRVTSNMVGLLLEYAFDGLGLCRVEWMTSSRNEKSMRVAERMGFRKEGVLRWHRCFRGGESVGKVGNGRSRPRGAGEGDLWRDTVVFGVCWDDWEEGGRERVAAVMECGKGKR